MSESFLEWVASWFRLNNYIEEDSEDSWNVFSSLEIFLFSFLNYIIDTVEHLILAILSYIVLCVILYLCITKWNLFNFTKDIRNAKRLLFVTAHPDDEVMFFGPTILHYTSKPGCMVFLLCLSSGEKYDIKKIRTNELYESCRILGIKEENIIVKNSTELPDSMDVRWPLEAIAKNVQNLVEVYNITNLVTFDKDGVSGHQNHSSIYYAIANLIIDNELPNTCGVYVLESVNLLRKYSLFLDIPISFIMSKLRYMEGFRQRRLIHKAMHQHKSQLVWFRKLYMMWSRYMLVNTLSQINLVDIELDMLEVDEDSLST